MMSPSLATNGCDNASIDVLAATDFTVSIANTAELLVNVNVIVSALPESLATRIDFIIAVVDGVAGTVVSSVVGTVYIVVASVVVKSTGFNKNVSANEPTPC